MVGAPKGVIQETHEPEVPIINWPNGHVAVDLTGAVDDECIVVTVHGVKHYLHTTTARELQKMLVDRIDEWKTSNAAELRRRGLPEV
jgi:hypothetical protein